MKYFVFHFYSCHSTCTWWLISLLSHKGSSREDRECFAVLASVTAKYFVSHFYSRRSTCTWWSISLLAHKSSSREDRECCAVLTSTGNANYFVFHFCSWSCHFTCTRCLISIIIYMKKLLDSDWLKVVQLLCSSVHKFVIAWNYNCKKYNLIFPEILLFKTNQSHATRKWRDLTYYAGCDKKLYSGHWQ